MYVCQVFIFLHDHFHFVLSFIARCFLNDPLSSHQTELMTFHYRQLSLSIDSHRFLSSVILSSFLSSVILSSFLSSVVLSSLLSSVILSLFLSNVILPSPSFMRAVICRTRNAEAASSVNFPSLVLNRDFPSFFVTKLLFMKENEMEARK